MSAKVARANPTYFGRIKDVDPLSQCVVFGFIRSMEQSVSTVMTIPIEIASICLLYYYNPEYFTKHGDYILLQDDKTVEHDWQCKYDSVYGKLEINDKDYIKCSWTFEVSMENNGVVMGIGISCDKEIINDIFANRANTYAYEYYIGGDIRIEDEIKPYGREWNNGDIIKMELDVANRILRYSLNSEDQGIAVQDINFDNGMKYTMAMYFDDHAIVKLLDFQATYTR